MENLELWQEKSKKGKEGGFDAVVNGQEFNWPTPEECPAKLLASMSTYPYLCR